MYDSRKNTFFCVIFGVTPVQFLSLSTNKKRKITLQNYHSCFYPQLAEIIKFHVPSRVRLASLQTQKLKPVFTPSFLLSLHAKGWNRTA
jgi:hypothetical protein